MKSNHLLKLLLIFAVAFTGCSDDDCNLDHPGNQLELPAIKNGTFPEGDIALNVGESYLFAPKVVTAGDVYYQWDFNGEDVSTEPYYNLDAERPMRSKLELALSNDYGRVALESKITVSGADYNGKYLIVNEGWFGHESGNITAFDPTDKSVEQWAFRTQNYGTTFGTTSQSATIWNGKLYVCSKDGKSLTVVDPQTLYLEKQSGSILGGRQAYEFIGINEQYGILTANADVYRVDLNTLKAEQIMMSDGYNGSGSGYVWGDKLLINIKGRKVHVVDLDKVLGDLSGYSWINYFPFTTIDVTTSGGCRFVKGADGNLYTIESTTTEHNLVRIKPDLSIEKTPVRSDYSPSSFSFYREASFCGTGKDNDFYYVAGGEIYKCSFNNAAPQEPFVNYDKAGYSLYGAGIRVNPNNGELVATYLSMNSPGHADYYQNTFVRFDGSTGEILSETEYEGYWFPGTVVFPN
ncbi:MAG: DUF5074 domain-containing protein [Bacteroides sp.]|nr:DUF5074 domain-containing protein [Bacteroides sp.]